MCYNLGYYNRIRGKEMEQTFTIKEKMKQLGIIFVPILVTQLAMFAMSFFDILMTGNYKSDHLAGVAVGSSYWIPISTGISGILLSITPIVAQLIGAQKKKDVSSSVLQGIYVAITLAILIMVIGALTLPTILNRMNLEENVRHVAQYYLISISIGTIPLFIYTVLRSFIDALGKTRTSMFITLLSLPINVIINYLLIYGKLGFPELGGIGSGIASAITYWLILVIAIYIIHKKQPFIHFCIFNSFPRASIKKWKEIILLGLPIGLSIFIETSIFSSVTLFMSKFGTTVIAAHQAALNFTSFIYMIPLSISMGLTILVGFEVGAKRYKDAKSYSYIGVGSGITISLVTGILLIILRPQISHMYSNDLEVIELTMKFLLFGAFFQLSDAILAPIQGTLRGYKDVNVTFIMAIISFWIIGLPIGYILANNTSMGPFGFWLGLIIGLAIGAITLAIRLLIVQKRFSLQESEQS